MKLSTIIILLLIALSFCIYRLDREFNSANFDTLFEHKVKFEDEINEIKRRLDELENGYKHE